MQLHFTTYLPRSGNNNSSKVQRPFRDALAKQLRATGLVGARLFMGQLALKLVVHDRPYSPMDLDNVAKAMGDALKCIGVTGDDRDIADLHVIRAPQGTGVLPLSIDVTLTLVRRHQPRPRCSLTPMRASLGEMIDGQVWNALLGRFTKAVRPR